MRRPKKQKKLSFVKIDYLDIDPNVPHSISELQKAGFFAMTEEEWQRNLIPELSEYATEIEGTHNEYDTKRLAKDYCFLGKVEVTPASSEHFIVHDNEKRLLFRKAQLQKYTTQTTTSYYVCKIVPIIEINDSGPLEIFIRSSTLAEKRNFYNNEIAILSAEQIDVIEHMTKTSFLRQHFEQEYPNILVLIQ